MAHKCGDCGRKTGEYHMENCDIERCPFCELQLLMCECVKKIETLGDGTVYYINNKGEKKEAIKVKTSVNEDFGD